MRQLRFIAIVAGLLVGAGVCGRPLVVASFPDMAALTQSVAGDLVDLQVIMPAGADPHAFSVTGEQIRALGRTDLLVLAYSQCHEFEATVHSALGQTPTLDWPDYVAEGARTYDYPDYPQNPHGPWLHLDNARAIARAIARRLIAIGVPPAAIQARLALFERELAAQQGLGRQLAAQAGLKPLLAVIPGVCDTIANLGVPVAGVLMGEGSGTVTGQQLTEAVSKLRSGEYSGLVCPQSMKAARQGQASLQIAREAGASIAWVRFMDTDLDRDTYLSVSAQNLATVAALGRVAVAAPPPLPSRALLWLWAAIPALLLILAWVQRRRRSTDQATGAGIFD